MAALALELLEAAEAAAAAAAAAADIPLKKAAASPRQMGHVRLD